MLVTVKQEDEKEEEKKVKTGDRFIKAFLSFTTGWPKVNSSFPDDALNCL